MREKNSHIISAKADVYLGDAIPHDVPNNERGALRLSLDLFGELLPDIRTLFQLLGGRHKLDG